MTAASVVLLAVLLALVITVLILVILLLRRPAAAPATDSDPGVPAKLTVLQVRDQLRSRLAGDLAGSGASSVVWSQDGNEVLVHLDATEARVAHGVLLVAVDLEAAETGRGQVIVPLALAGQDDDGAGLVVATSAQPFGQAQLVARWGSTVQDAVWGSLVQLAVERSLRTGGQPAALALVDGVLQVRTDGGSAA
jgi:hypothetical protein